MAELKLTLEDTLRDERTRILAALLRLCGDLDAAEDALQDAVISALVAWRKEVPANAGAWLMTAAKNSARDAMRHRALAGAKALMLIEDEAFDAVDTLDEIHDDALRLLFTCCHPVLGRESQIALTLKVVAGFDTDEIARAFLTTEETISQRILRAKRAIQAHAVPYATPARDELEHRASAVLGVLYALFNEGHVAHQGPLMRVDLQAEALRLARLMCDLVPHLPEPFGLLALIAFGAARAHTRIDANGVPILLAAQDRAAWSRELIREGLIAMQHARGLQGRGAYVLQAEIAALHVTATKWETTPWPRIVDLYDALMDVENSPVVALNRAVALSMRDGPIAALAALAPLERQLDRYHLFYATRARLLERAGRDGRADWARALELATNEGERLLLQQRITF